MIGQFWSKPRKSQALPFVLGVMRGEASEVGAQRGRGQLCWARECGQERLPIHSRQRESILFQQSFSNIQEFSI